MFDDEKREVLILPARTPIVITDVQERFLDFARNDDTGKALFSEPRNLKAGIRDERPGILALFDEMVRANAHLFYKYATCGEIESAEGNAAAASPHRHPERSRGIPIAGRKTLGV